MVLKQIVKDYWKKMHHEPARYRWIFSIYNNVLGRNHIHGKKGNRWNVSCAKVDRTEVNISGYNNEIVIGVGAQIYGCRFVISGNNNRIIIGDDVNLFYTELWISKDENEIIIGDKTMISGKKEYPTHLAAIEGTRLEVGQDCIMSSAVEIRTGDGHSITDLNGKRVNPSKSIQIGEHVWIGSGVVCNKGITITDHCIIGTKSVVTKSVKQSYCAVGGNPAHVLRTDVDWNKELLPCEESSV